MNINPFFIAEIGINHSGDFEKAKWMCSKSADCGASIIKSQYYDAEKVLGKGSPYYEEAKACQLSKRQHENLAKYCRSIGLGYAVSVFDINDVRWASSFSPLVKIATRMNTDPMFIYSSVQTGLPVYMSIQEHRQRNLIYKINYLWCVPKYPASKEQVLAFDFDDKHGLSSHCPDYTATIEAYDKGARVFENHVCLSKEEKGCDVPASVTFEDYAKIISSINSSLAA